MKINNRNKKNNTKKSVKPMLTLLKDNQGKKRKDTKHQNKKWKEKNKKKGHPPDPTEILLRWNWPILRKTQITEERKRIREEGRERGRKKKQSE